jgi:hypothetical protein
LVFGFLWGLLVLLGFWWFTSIKRVILASDRISYLVLRQGLFSALIIFGITFIIIQSFNLGVLSLLIVIGLLIILWIPIHN